MYSAQAPRPPRRRVDVARYDPRRPKRSKARRLFERLTIAVAVVTATFLFRSTVAQAYYIPSESMYPTLKVNDRVIVSKVGRGFDDIHRGDIIVFKGSTTIDAACDPDHHLDNLIKRVVALPGDVIESRDGIVYINGVVDTESYLPANTMTTDLPKQRVPAEHVWVMGDNRNDSCDSRFWGPLAQSAIVGKAEIRYWPLSKPTL